MNRDLNDARLVQLTGLLCDEIISPEQVDELERLLAESSEARRLYHVCLSVFQDLESLELTEKDRLPTFVPGNAAGEQRPSSRSRIAQGFRRTSLLGRLALAAMLLVTLGIGFFGVRRGPVFAPLAQIVELVDVEWESPPDAFSVGDYPKSRRLKFNAGMVHIQFPDGAEVAIEGPAEFEVTSADSGFLWSGKLVAFVPEGAEGFRVDTPQTDVVDLGTEFGLRVDQQGSQLHVFQGEVKFSDKLTNKENPTAQRIVTAGLAVAIDQKGRHRPVELAEFSFDVPRNLLWKNSAISTRFMRANTTDYPGGVPGQKGGGWTGAWEFSCDDGQIDATSSRVVGEFPLGPDLRNYLSVTASNQLSQPFTLSLARGFLSSGRVDTQARYIVQFLLRIDSDLSHVDRIEITDTAIGNTVFNHCWKLSAMRQPGTGATLRWQGFPTVEGVDDGSHDVIGGKVYRVLVEVHPRRSRFRISLSDGSQTLASKWMPTSPPSGNSEFTGVPHRRLEWRFDANRQISISLDSIRIQNYAKNDAKN